MQRTGRTANMLSKPSNDRNSACLNWSELQDGHSCLVQSMRGTHLGHVLFEKFISSAPRARSPGCVAAQILPTDWNSNPAMRASSVCFRWPAPCTSHLLHNKERLY